MALALESLTFSVETKELENAIQKIKELGQAASSLSKPIEQLGKQASEAGKKVEKAASASEVLAAGSTKAKTATDNLNKSQEKTNSSAAKMQALIERLSNTYMDLSNGMTRGESNILNAARSFGALEAQLEPVRKVLEQIKELSKDPFDAAIGSVRRISQEFEQFKQRTDLANQGIYLSTKQLQEYSKIASEIKGKLVSSGVKEGSAEYQERFASMLAETNKQYLDYVSKLNSGLAAEQARNKALAEQERLMQAQERLLQQNATAMDEVAKRWKFMQSQKAEQERNAAIKEQNRLLAQGSVMMDDAVNKFKSNQIAKEQEKLNEQLREQNRLIQQGTTAMDSAVEKWKAIQIAKADQETNRQIAEQNRLLQQGLTMMDSAVNKFKAGQLAKEQEKLNEQLRKQNRLMQQGATAMDSAVIEFYNRKHQALNDLVKAEQSLVDQEQRLQFVTQKTSEGFTVASANALYRYEQSLKKAGVTEQEFINRSSAYSNALKARQDVSDTNARRKAATEELIRIEKQLEDQEKFLAYATAEFSKQQQQATAGNQNFADSLSMGSLRALFAYEQALRRAGVAEIDVASKSEVMRKQMLQMQQATESFNGSVNHLGRNVGVQFTDIFVSLYNGQPIMQVITQQGGQLADAFLLAGVSGQNMSQHLVDGFKKILESYKMLGAAFAGLAKAGFDKVIDTFAISTTYLKDSFVELMNTAKTANSMNEVLAVGFNKLTVAVTALGRATALLTGTLGLIAAVEVYKSVKAYDDLTTSLIRFGGAILGGVDGARQYANELQELGWSAGKASEYITAVAKSGNLSEDQMRNLAAATKDMDTWLNVSFEDTVKLHSEIKKAPVEAVVKLAKETGLVSSAVLDNIIKYEQAGETQKAVMAAMNEAIRVHGEQVNSAKKNYSDFAVFIIEIGESIKKAYNSIFSYIFEKTSPESALKEQVKTLEDRLANPNMFDKLDIALGGENRKNLEETLKLSKQELDVLVKQLEEQEKKSKAEYARNKNAGVNADVQSKALAEINRADAKKMSQQEYINAVLKEQNRLYGENVLDAKSLSLIQQQAAKDWKKANESQAKPKTSFSTSVGNTIVETSRKFEQRLQLEQKLTQDQLVTLENYYKDGLNSKGNYLAQEVNIVTASREKQLQILEQYNDAELAAFAEKEAKLRANAAIAVAKGGDAKAIGKQLQQNLADLAMQKQTFNEKITGKQELAYSAVTKILSKSLSEVSKSTQEVTNDVEKFSLELAKQQVSRQADIQFAAETIGMSEKEIAVLKAKMQVQEQYNKLLLDTSKNIAESESAFWEFVQGIDPMNSEALDKAWAMWQGIHKAKMKLTEAGIEQELAQRIAMQDAALEHDLANYKRLQDGIADAITSGLLEGGEEGKKKLRDIIVAELRKPITLQINAFVNSVLSDVIGLPGNNSSEQGTNSGILGNLSSLNSAYKLINNSISSSITKGFSSFATSDVGIKMGLGTSNTSAVGPVKPGLTSTGTAVNSALTMAGNAVAGYGLQKSISGGYKTGESELVDAATVIASAIYGPLAGVTAGVFNRAFGRKLKDQGIEGTFGTADGFDGNAYQDYKGGWFRSDKTKRQALDADVEDALETQFKALQIQTALMAQTLGLGVDSVANFTAKIKVSFNGLSEEQISQRMAEEFGKIAESMSSAALGTTEYTRTGETAVETLTRLSSSLTTVNGTFDALGLKLLDTSLAGADMASQLVDLMGGLENFTAATASYYENFYTEAERTEVATRQLTDSLASIGINTMPTTREAFRSLVEAQDMTTESGRETFSALIALSSAFDSVTEKAAEFSNEITAWYEDILGRTPDSSGFDYWSNQVSSGLMSMEKAAEAFSEQAGMELLQRQLLELVDPQQSLVEARARELSLLPESQRAIQQQIWARQEELRVIEQRTSLEEQLLQVTDNSSAIRAKERSEIYASNLALFDLVKSLEDFKALSTELEAAMNNAASAAEKVKSIQDKATSNYVQAQDKVAEAQKKIQDIQNENLKQQIEKAKELSNAFSDLSKSMKDFVYGEIKPSSQLFTETLEKALAGNQEAMKELPNAATAAIEQAKNTSGTLEEYERKRAKILAGVLQAANVADNKSIDSSATATSLEAKLTPEQTAMQQAQKELADALKEQKDALKIANAISASLVVTQEDLIAEYKAAKAEQAKADTEVLSLSTQLTNLANATAALATATGNLPAALSAISINAEANIKSAITMATASDLPAELKQIALASLNDLQSNFEVVSSNKSMPAEIKQVAMAAIASSSSNFGVIAKSTSIPAEVKQIALGAASAVTSNINTVVTQAANGTIPASIAKLALGAEGGISTTITTTVSQAETGKIPASIAKLVLNSVNGLSTDVTANVIQSGSLDDASKAIILSATDTIAKTFNVTVQNASGTTVPAVISNLALKTNEQLAKSLEVTVALAKDKTVPTVISTLAGTAIDTVSRTISTTVSQAANGKIPQEIATLAGTTADTIGKTIDVTLAAVQAGKFPTWVDELALNSTNNAAKIVDVTINQAATNKDEPWITNLKLLTGDAVGKTVQIAMGGDPTLTAAQAALKITSADNLLKTVDLALSDSKLTAGEKQVIESLVKNTDGTITINGGSDLLTALNSLTTSVDALDFQSVDSSVTFNPDESTKSMWSAIVKSTALTVNALYAVHNAVLSLGRAQGLTGLSSDIAGIFSANEAKAFAESFRAAAGTTSSTQGMQAWSSWSGSSSTGTGTGSGTTTTPTTPTVPTTPVAPTTTPVVDPNAEAFKILDKLFVLSKSEATNPTQRSVWDAYVGVGHRVPDQGGFDWWSSTISSGAKTVQQLKDNLLGETKTSAKLAISMELAANGVNQELANSLAGQYSFSTGGYTGAGGVLEPAGIVHAGEVVFSQKDIARLGGVGVVEGIRTGEIPMFANGGIVQPGSHTSVQVTQHDNSELVQELQSLREEVKMLRAEARATAMNTSKTARILDDVTQGGTEVKVAQTEEFTALFGK